MSQDVFDLAARAYVDSVGDAVEYNGSTVWAVFGNGWQAVASGDVRVSSRRPSIYVRLSDLPDGALAKFLPGEPGDLVDIRGSTYEVVTVRPDTEEVGAHLTLKLVV